MDLLERHLAMAERQVAAGQRHVDIQQQLVEMLKRAGSDIEEATKLLRQFEVTQISHIAHRDRLRKELGGLTDLVQRQLGR
jgi:hypothetical protein